MSVSSASKSALSCGGLEGLKPYTEQTPICTGRFLLSITPSDDHTALFCKLVPKHVLQFVFAYVNFKPKASL